MAHRYSLILAVTLWLGGGLLAETASAQRRRGAVVNTEEGAAGRVVTPTGRGTVIHNEDGTAGRVVTPNQICTGGVNTSEGEAGGFCRQNRRPGAAAVINDNNNQPEAAVVITLPPNYQTVVVAGVTYYTVNGVYYVYDPGRQGYVVVVAPQ
ncbi:hypothetical protein GlitD10_0457 [Gloeomargarita lithophora Alchichica-D10]|uniref:Uncharacterized protein n=1 Tax=Gloeomargarita lithophora Alchichica-D10 TaxID=1188229 RepID=A0A1J0AA02_9CYAN|nr:hypothetical protein [Gloeomargarita lithophora]APB32768.1 hypothetical protein GlitD10_0457 [Gloeomargarita lithophora Alchichica-D10]